MNRSIIMEARGHLQMETIFIPVFVGEHSIAIRGKGVVKVPERKQWDYYMRRYITTPAKEVVREKTIGQDVVAIYTTKTRVIIRNTDTGRFASMADWNSMDCQHNDEDLSDDQPWYFPGNTPYSPEDQWIDTIDNDNVGNEELDAYVSHSLSLSELEEWIEFHNSWQEKEPVVKVMVKKDEGHVTYRVPADTVLPDDKPMLEELDKELEKPIPSRDEKHGGPQTWDSKKEHRSFKLKETHKGHQPRGPIRMMERAQFNRVREAWLKKQQRRNAKKGN